ncbi:efflux RND transporter periplasmic adaptor subunit [Neptunomonas japonica]|uniref:RND family efflux transporter MFP subunit n=1 Tax=Neptunomonas japonica JAMM 1380 TaxID=1441457 RepID=A0A7R6PNE1_9GAMM|nr:efflux RND transporter periplasmic adaptor subunit [Neptunomonas japonica]BBB29607.1 RND family efflux transporter MFP subunit [Neptunomonas japonica JAMM 1380]
MFRSVASFILLVSFIASAPEAIKAQELSSVKVVKTIMPLQRLLDGSVEAISQATVSAQTSGVVDQVMVDVGDHVPAGSVILTLVGIDQKETLNQAKASLSEADAQRKAQSQQYERVKALYAKKLLSKANYDSAVASYNSAKARFTSAQAALNRARQQVSYTEIKAAYGGVVSGRHVEVGEAVQPGMPLLSGFDPHHLRVYADLPQSIAAIIREKPLVNVLLDSGVMIAPLKVSFFPVADAATGTVRMRLELPVSENGLYPGKLVKVAVQTGEKARLLVPESSVVYRSEVAGVYVLATSRGDVLPQLRQVRVGSHFANQVEVLSGLMVGEAIAIDPIAAGILTVTASIEEKR